MITEEKQGKIDVIARGQRILAIRNALKLSRQKFSDKHNIPKGTLQTWEDGRHNGLSEHGAKRIIKAFSDEEIHCSLEWLLYGMGQPPALPASLLVEQQIITRVNEPLLSEQQIIQQELLLFHQLNRDCIDTIVPDDAMFPIFQVGDLIAGQRYFDAAIEKTVGHNCIVQTSDGKILVRKVQRGTKTNYYHLIAYNKKYEDEKDISLFSAAPIIWSRRKAPSQ